MTTTTDKVRGQEADSRGNSLDPTPELQRLDGVGLAVAMRLARRGLPSPAHVAALADPDEVAVAAGVGPDQAARIWAAARGQGPSAAPPATDGVEQPSSLVPVGSGFTVAPPRAPDGHEDVSPGVLVARMALMERRRGGARGQPRPPLASARLCLTCGLIISYARPHLARPRERGELPSHGAKYSYSVHLCEVQSTVAAHLAPEELRRTAARNQDNAHVFRELESE